MSINAYRTALRSNVRGFWTGALSEAQFEDGMRTAINRRLTQAFLEGAEKCGVKEDELTNAENLALGRAIQKELTFIQGLTDDINANKRGVGKLGPFMTRVSGLWLNRWNDLKNFAQQLVCDDNQKMIWRLGPTIESCNTCPRLDRKVKRNSVWQAAGLRPQNPPNSSLECQGFE